MIMKDTVGKCLAVACLVFIFTVGLRGCTRPSAFRVSPSRVICPCEKTFEMKMKTTDASENVGVGYASMVGRPEPLPATSTIVYSGCDFCVVRIELKNGLVFIANSNGGIVKES